MKSLSEAPVTPATEGPATTGVARVTYRVTVGGTTRTFTAETTVSGCGADAALTLVIAVCDDACDWLRAHVATPVKAVRVTGMFRQRRVVVPAPLEPSTERGSVTATLDVDGVVHEYRGGVATVGDPSRATRAAVLAAKNDLWNWAWDFKGQKKTR